eukprot:TRINITY_DN24040_c0_g1_i1.p1 TRINITY_DN24040_c0_g1~~TRINITY_DN24040_c0_g1_i1.p1  ORF type:complete len:233 (-),score=66.82 TRINITY_DN24040_c0_g1_i1:45-743(-)
MDSIIGLTGKDFVLIAADTSSLRSIVKLSNADDKILPIDTTKLLAASGPIADRHQFTEYIEKNITLRKFRSSLSLTTHATANYIRSELAYALRSAPYQTNLLLGGVDEDGTVAMYWMDYLASMTKVEFGAHGYASYFVMSIMDKYYQKGMTEEQGVEVLRKCVEELRIRFIVNLDSWIVKIVTKDGIRIVPFSLENKEGANNNNNAGSSSNNNAGRAVERKEQDEDSDRMQT